MILVAQMGIQNRGGRCMYINYTYIEIYFYINDYIKDKQLNRQTLHIKGNTDNL